MAKRERTGLARLKYGEEEEIWEEEEERPAKRARRQSSLWRLPARVLAVLLVAALVVALWMGRDGVQGWFAERLAGVGVGDGYPARITGTQVLPANLQANGSMAVVLSDTSLTVLNATAKEIFSRQHSFASPRMCMADDRYLLYHFGGPGYRMETIGGTALEGTAAGDIQAAALAKNGRFALATLTDGGASRLTVYLAGGDVQYTYTFHAAYITSLALNRDGTRGVVATVATRGGALNTTLYLFDFSKEEPTALCDAGDNLALAVYWGDNGRIVAVGDTAVLYGGENLEMTQVAYGQAQVSAYAAESSGVCVALHEGEAAYALLLNGEAEPVRVQLAGPALACSLRGDTAGVLTDGLLTAYDRATGEALGSADAGRDACGVALCSESTAYVLGLDTILLVDMDAA